MEGKRWQQFTLTEMATLDFRGFATTLGCQKRIGVHAVQKHEEILDAKHRLCGTNYRTRLEMEGVSCMAAFQLAQRPKWVEMPYGKAIEGEEGKVSSACRGIIFTLKV